MSASSRPSFLTRHRRMLAVARKESLHILRDWRSLALALAIPLMLLMLFGWALTMDVQHVPVIVWNQAPSPLSREFTGLMEGSRYFDLVEFTDNYADIERALQTKRALLAVVIPADFAARLQSGEDAPVQFIADGADANTARICLNYANSLTLMFTQQRAQTQGMQYAPPVDLAARAWYNPTLKSQDYIIPGLIALIMAVIAGLLTSLTVAREWELGTMEQLIATPVRASELITGKLIPYWIIGMIDVAMAITLGMVAFGMPFRGNLLLVALASGLFLIGMLSQGILVSINLKSQVLASQMALLSTFLPTMFLSGFVYALMNMPVVHRVVSYVVPARYFITVLRGVILIGVGLEVLWLPMVLLLAYGLALFGIANKRFVKRLA